jgi:predicted AlkP superfamily phosphohydrolase/phosphomutase
MKARAFLALGIALAFLACGTEEPTEPYPVSVFIFGFDGMEPTIVEEEMAAGRMPAFSRLAEEGGYRRLGTSLPPESPVAWACFNTGHGPGGHGVFDFIHRRQDEHGVGLVQATAQSTQPSNFVGPLFGYRLPLSWGETKLTVAGKFFWEYLSERGIPASIIRVPSNYPPRETGARTFAGMGTPDLLGTYGVLSYYTDDPPLSAVTMRRSGSVHVMLLDGARGPQETELRGPENVCRPPIRPNAPSPYSSVPMMIYPDAERGVARIDIADRSVILKAGEWSEWVPVSFPLIPTVLEVPGMVRLYLKEVSPHIRLYVSPVNADPLDPAMSISTPPDAATDLAKGIGRYYTQGMAEDTQALRLEVFDTAEFLAQAELVLDERRKMLDFEVERFRKVGGATFFYFSTTDLCAHMLFKYMDDKHPAYDPEGAKLWGGKLAEIYREMDRILGKARERLPEDTRVVVMSDHGFKSFRRQLSLNTWLYENGFLALKDPGRRGQGSDLANLDLTRTKAYAVGFSGIYLNPQACPDPERTKKEIVEGLLALVDPKTGERPVHAVHRREDVYEGTQAEKSPDLIVGFSVTYGCAESSVLGSVPRELFTDTLDAWSGSHLMDPSLVPGIFLANGEIEIDDPGLIDLPKSILADFGIDVPSMPGRRIWKTEGRK